MAFLELERIRKRFGDLVVLDGIDAAVAEGETLVLLGPSGSGKTTLLRILAGFETPEEGRLRVAGEDVSALPPARRNFGMVFQHYALFPHLDVGKNVAFGLAARGVPAAAQGSRVAEMLALVELPGFERRAVHEISGGQQQRVALARALAPSPRVLLLDEPLSNLDPALRERTRRQLRAVLRRVGITAVWVTHEQQEAFDVGDRIALLDGGRLQQLGTAAELYSRPASRFVADFVGQASWLGGRRVAAGEVEVAPGVRWRVAADAGAASAGEVAVMLRPEDACLVQPATGVLAGRVRASRFTGHATEVEVELDDGTRLLVASHEAVPAAGSLVGVEPLAGRSSPRAFAPAGGDGGAP
ncbi:MAG: ABC transporter ATP-binding protein [Acidobacteriota bacterium]|nr:ABC transporter ATP-binding protein [Acidobacteriota bacterium]MDH3525069.1 ABC transporter ATP-binding protein [Acidobacteriota bacterium]